MSKVAFEGQESESVLREWETMHRPTDHIPTSGPQYTKSLSSSSRAGLIVPPPGYIKGGTSGRRHSAISPPKDIHIPGTFPLRNGSKSSKLDHRRRLSEAWLGKGSM